MRGGTATVFLCNLLWWLCCVPRAVLFAAALRFPQRAQRRVLRRIVRSNRTAAWGRRAGFEGVRGPRDWAAQPTTDYEDYRDGVADIASGNANVLTVERVLLLEPTSGSTGANKLVPYTAALQREFRRAIEPWMASLYWNHPRLLFSRHYWAVSPTTRVHEGVQGCVRVGFAEDAEYLGGLQRRIARVLFAVPRYVGRIEDTQAARVMTAFFLAAAPDVGLVSVWHPTFFEAVLETLRTEARELAAALREGRLPRVSGIPEDVRMALAARVRPMPHRADQLLASIAADNPQALWPRLRLVSCWSDARAAAGARRLALRFPRARVQGKGLLATEGVVTIPWGRDARTVAAVRSHYLELEEAETGQVVPLQRAVAGRDYLVLLTTGGGLYRYHLGDRVQCDSRIGRTPCFVFVGREGCVCDLVGEKLHGVRVERALRAADPEGTCEFAMLAPDDDERGYLLFVDATMSDPDALAARVDVALRTEYHYDHARAAGQLRAIAAVPLPRAASRHRAVEEARGLRSGAIKVPPLDPRPGWRAALWGSWKLETGNQDGEDCRLQSGGRGPFVAR